MRATFKHRVLTGSGWKTLGTLTPGDRMALARRLPEPARPQPARAEMYAQGVTQGAMTQMRAASYGDTSHFRFAPGRAQLGDYAARPASTQRDEWACSDLLWDRVVTVAPDGEEDVYDLTVPGPANWLADGIVSHNSGAIEQDADMILLIYREEVYDRNTTKKGIAEIDLVKHRNGEIGTFLLTFQGQYTRFANYVPDSYAEGILR